MPEALAHAPHAVRAHQDGDQEALLGALPHHPLEVPPDEQVELLVSAPELDVGLNLDGVVGLHEGVEQLSDGYGLVCLIALVEVVPRQKLGYGEAAGEPEDIVQAERTEPVALEPGLRAVPVHDLEELGQVRLCVAQHLLLGEHRPGRRLTAGIADLRRPVTNDDDHVVAQIL